MNKKYTALILDIVDSRKELNRQIVQERMKNCIDYLNKYYKDMIVKPVICSAGDEFQGLFSSTKMAYSYARKLQMYVYPIKIRVGIGVGELKYLVGSWKSTEIDGEAYYYARDAINEIPDKGNNVIFINDQSERCKLINTISLTNSKLKTRETGIMRYIEFLLDFLSPLDNYKKELTEDDYEFIRSICLEYLESISRVNKAPTCETGYSLPKIIEVITIESLKKAYNSVKKASNECMLYYSDGIPWGVVKLIENFVGTSQQNINQYLNSRGIKESRKIDSAIINYLGLLDSEVEK